MECKKPKKDKEVKEKALIAQVPNEEPALLMAMYSEEHDGKILINEEKVTPKLGPERDEKMAESNLWYLDNGASNHMSGQREKLNELDESVSGKVKFSDNSVVHINGKGSVTLLCNDSENRTIKEVDYIPSLRSNIISLGQLSKEGRKVILNGDCLWIRDKQGALLMKVNVPKIGCTR